MARGPAPKPAHMRQRRNKKAGAATLTEPVETVKPPTLPNPDKRKWHRLTRAWWRSVWQSPMASEYLETDMHGLARLAMIIDDFYQSGNPKLLAEIRLQEARFGLSPIDRSRLQWEVQKGEEAERRRRPKTAAQSQDEDAPAADPRDVLRVVK